MIFEYQWSDEALEQLADIYVAADEVKRDVMARAVERFNSQLARDPHSLGESREGMGRIAFPASLQVYFYVFDARGWVYVTKVSRFGN